MMIEGVSAEDSATLNGEGARVDDAQLAIEDNQTQHHLQAGCRKGQPSPRTRIHQFKL